MITSLERFLEASRKQQDPQEDREGASDSPEMLGQILADVGAVTIEAVSDASQRQKQGDTRKIGEILIETTGLLPASVEEALEVQAERRNQQITSSAIRVNVGLLDKVMNLVGELVLARNQVLQFTSGTKDAGFLKTAQRLNLITTELQEGVMKTRMQPIGNIWKNFPRTVRDVSLACGKLAELQMEGADTELDKTIIEAIKDPLTHIVRNSIDHGIELPGVRQKAGKATCGAIRLRAFHEGGQVNIVVSDDGAGVGLRSRTRKGSGKRVWRRHRKLAGMSEQQICNLSFLPGLSTAARVTNISGRGVGMDVVKTNIEKIGGTVGIETVQGRGTTIKIRIPLTLAIIPALLVMSGGERFAIPQVSLVELVRLEGAGALSGIEMVHGAPVHRLRGRLLPLLSLNKQLRLATEKASGGEVPIVNIVVLQADGRQFGLIVDNINDTEEIVVKPLGKQLKGISCFAGATILGDGRVALILDVPGLAQGAHLARETHPQVTAEQRKQENAAGMTTESWLLFRVGTSGRLAIPLNAVSRLEEFSIEAIETSDHRPVIQYRGAIMPLIFISDTLHLHPSRQDESRVQVVVSSEGDRNVGLVVDEILDIVDQHLDYTKYPGSEYLLGSAVLQEHVTDLLNVSATVAGFLRSHDFALQENSVHV